MASRAATPRPSFNEGIANISDAHSSSRASSILPSSLTAISGSRVTAISRSSIFTNRTLTRDQAFVETSAPLPRALRSPRSDSDGPCAARARLPPISGSHRLQFRARRAQSAVPRRSEVGNARNRRRCESTVIALTIDARSRERIRNSTRDRHHAIDRAIEQERREHPIGPVVHPPRHDQRTAEAARKRRHRMRARSMEVDDVVTFAFENRAQPDAGSKVDRVADVQRMASVSPQRSPAPRAVPAGSQISSARWPAPQPAPSVNPSTCVSPPAKPKFRIDAHDAQLLALDRVALGGHLDCVVVSNGLRHIQFGRINRKICSTGSRTPPSPRRGCRSSCPLHRCVPNTRPALRKFAIARAPPWR